MRGSGQITKHDIARCVNRAKPDSEDIMNALGDHIAEKSVLLFDGLSSYNHLFIPCYPVADTFFVHPGFPCSFLPADLPCNTVLHNPCFFFRTYFRLVWHDNAPPMMTVFFFFTVSHRGSISNAVVGRSIMVLAEIIYSQSCGRGSNGTLGV